jgi:hypothetical protein
MGKFVIAGITLVKKHTLFINREPYLGKMSHVMEARTSYGSYYLDYDHTMDSESNNCAYLVNMHLTRLIEHILEMFGCSIDPYDDDFKNIDLGITDVEYMAMVPMDKIIVHPNTEVSSDIEEKINEIINDAEQNKDPGFIYGYADHNCLEICLSKAYDYGKSINSNTSRWAILSFITDLHFKYFIPVDQIDNAVVDGMSNVPLGTTSKVSENKARLLS